MLTFHHYINGRLCFGGMIFMPLTFSVSIIHDSFRINVEVFSNIFYSISIHLILKLTVCTLTSVIVSFKIQSAGVHRQNKEFVTVPILLELTVY